MHENIITDFKNCLKAQDKFLLNIHSQRINEINNVIEKIWKQTYVGHDSDTILMKSEQKKSKG